jgi:ferric-dicitrate binding protein FerR (iron transport regulator)
LNQHYHIPLEDLLVKYLLQEASPEERRTVDEWLAADPANQRHYDQLLLIWENSLRLTPRGGLPNIEGEEETVWQVLKEKLHTPTHRAPVRILRWTAAAAAAAAVLFFFLWPRPDPVTWQQTASRDAIRTVTLTDGSIVTLNRHSSLSQPSTFATKERTVILQGEAFFQIAPDKNRPFHIQTNGITVTVLGTSFNVRTQNKKTVVLVETGLVEVYNGQTRVRLQAGETITLDPNDPTPRKQPAGTSVYKYYRPRDFVCRDTPLGELVDALNQAYGDSIVIGNPALRQLPITTTFHDESLHDILDVVKKTLRITIQYSGSRYTLQ